MYYRRKETIGNDIKQKEIKNEKKNTNKREYVEMEKG